MPESRSVRELESAKEKVSLYNFLFINESLLFTLLNSLKRMKMMKKF